jgi:hypothetical protein
MWDVLVRTPLGTPSRRKFSHVLASFIVVLFGYIFLSAPTAAAADATWEGDAISYDGRTYDQVDQSSAFPGMVNTSPAIYRSVDDTQTPNLVYFIYFAPGTTDQRSEKEATYVRYTLNPPDRYVNPTPGTGRTITIEPSPQSEVVNNSDGIIGNECTIEGIGWLVCPIMNGIAEGMDFIYERIRGFLTVQPITASVNNPIYRIWNYSRDLANIAFVIGFMIIIYSYLAGGGFNGYEIRKILPRLVIAAILINVSYILCAVAVDISNIAGYGVNQLFENVRDEVLPGSSTSAGVNWTSVTSFVLAGGVGLTVGALVLPAAIGGLTGLWLMLATFLFGAALLVMVTFLILAARQALIVILIAIAPLAFAAFILPNTEKWFEKWRSVFFTMLIMFPAFGAVFGGAQLAGEVIIRTATTIEQVILGLGVLVAPLAITPLLLKLGGGVLNRFGGIVNNPRKGLYDRYKNHNNERRAEHLARWQADNATMRREGTFKRRKVPFTRNKTMPAQLWKRSAARSYAMKNYRETMKGLDEERGKNEWDAQHGRWGGDNHQGRNDVRSRITGRPVNGYGNLDEYKRRNAAFHDNHHAQHDEHWQQVLRSDSSLRGMVTDTAMTKGRAGVMSSAIEAEDERTFQNTLNNDAGYATLKNMKQQTSVDAGIAKMNELEIEAGGKAKLQREIFGDKALKAMNVRTVALEKEAATIESTLKQRAEENWERITTKVNDPGFDGNLRNLRLQENQSAQQLESSKKQWTELVENINALGASAPTITSQADKSVAGNIKQVQQDIAITDRAIEAAKVVQSENLAATFKDSQEAKTNPNIGGADILIRAGGIGGERAQTRIFAKAKSDVVNAAVEEVKTNRTLTSEMTRFQLHKLMREAKMPDGQEATVEMQQAAMYALLQEKGNNQDANEIRDAVSKMGLMVDDDGRYYEALRDNNGRIIPNANGWPQIDRSKEVKDKNEISRRRDWQQFFDDAAGGSPHSMVTYSGTNKSEARSGNMVDDIRGGFLRDATSGKFSPEKILKADIDELKTLLEDINSPSGYYAGLDSEKQQQVNATLESAILRLQGNENINAGIDDRNRGVMNDILATVNPTDYAPTIRNGKRVYPVDANKAIVPPSARTGDEQSFAAPVDVPGVHRPGSYYSDWDVDLQL